jgi:hypothetical protein
MTELYSIDIEKIKLQLKDELIPYMNKLFPDGKIPLYITPLANTSENYLTWSGYSTEGPLSEFTDNYCRPDETGAFFYPTINDDLKSCEQYYTPEVKDLTDLNEIIYNSIAIAKEDDSIEIKTDEIKSLLDDKINDYKKFKLELIQQEKTLNNLQNISSIINDLSKKLNKSKFNTQNQVNINKDTIEEEKYRYAPTQYYIYTIVVLVIIAFIIHFTVLYY